MDVTNSNFSHEYGSLIHENWATYFEILNLVICTLTFTCGVFTGIVVFCSTRKEKNTNSYFEIQASVFIVLRCLFSGMMSVLLLSFDNILNLVPVQHVILALTSMKPIHQIIQIALAINPIVLQKLLLIYKTEYQKTYFQLIPFVSSLPVAVCGYFIPNAYSRFIIPVFTSILAMFNILAYMCSLRFNRSNHGLEIRLQGVSSRLKKSVLDLFILLSEGIICLIFYLYGEKIGTGTAFSLNLVSYLLDTSVPIFLLFLDLVNIFHVDQTAVIWKNEQFRKIFKRERVGPTMRRPPNYSASPNDHPVFSVNVV